MSDKIGMQIGGISKQGVEAVEKAILSILTAPAEQKTIRVALETLRALSASHPVNNTSVSNVSVDMREGHVFPVSGGFPEAAADSYEDVTDEDDGA